MVLVACGHSVSLCRERATVSTAANQEPFIYGILGGVTTCLKLSNHKLLSLSVVLVEYVNAQELPTDLRSITDRAATTLLWTELFRGNRQMLCTGLKAYCGQISCKDKKHQFIYVTKSIVCVVKAWWSSFLCAIDLQKVLKICEWVEPFLHYNDHEPP